jgi:hypothetical protein
MTQKMKSSLLQKQTSRRDILRGSVTLAGGAVLAHLFPVTLLRASAAGLGHGPLGRKADLTKFRDMLVTSRDRVVKLKSAGQSALEAVAEKPFADLDPGWGQGIINSDQWVQIVYLTL